MDASKDDLKAAVEKEHGGTATHALAVPVNEKERGQSIWHGIVHVFNLTDNQKAKRAYAWSTPVEGSDERRIITMLQIPPINGPIEAVRAALAAELQAKHGHQDVNRNAKTTGSPHRGGAPVGRGPSSPSKQRGRGG